MLDACPFHSSGNRHVPVKPDIQHGAYARHRPLDQKERVLIGRRAALAAVARWSGRLIALAVTLLITPFLVHRRKAQYGLFMLVSAVMGQGALFDLRPAVIKYVAEYRARADNDRLRSVVATALVICCFLGLIALLLTAALAPFFPDLFVVPTSERNTATIIVWLMGIWLCHLDPRMGCSLGSAQVRVSECDLPFDDALRKFLETRTEIATSS
jgi:hypothetical protein